MHRPLVPRIHAKSNETQGNAGQNRFCGLKWLATQAETPSSANKRLQRSCEFTVTRMHITKPDCAAFHSRSHRAVIRSYDEAGNVIERHEQTLRCGARLA